MHSMHDERFVESQLEVHVESMIEEDEQSSFAPGIDEEQTNAQTTSRVVVFAGTCRQGVLESDRIVLQEVGRLEKHGDPCQMREMVVHSSLGLPIDELQTDATTTNKVATFLGNNPPQGYIGKACRTTCTLSPIIGRGAGFLRQMLLMDQTQ